jgi:hypothetical protein
MTTLPVRVVMIIIILRLRRIFIIYKVPDVGFSVN